MNKPVPATRNGKTIHLVWMEGYHMPVAVCSAPPSKDFTATEKAVNCKTCLKHVN